MDDSKVVLMLRLYAMYESSKKILVLFVLLLVGEIVAIAYIVGASIPGEVGKCHIFIILVPIPSVL
jgi:hypothetical protein